MSVEPCGQCDRNRHIERPDGRMERCPRCHPLRRQITTARCPAHPAEPAGSCGPCAGMAKAAPEPEPDPTEPVWLERRRQMRLIHGGADRRRTA